MDRNLLHSVLRPRHLLLTLLVALSTSAVGITVVAAADVAQAESTDPWNEPFTVPVPSAGDRGRFVLANPEEVRDDGYWPTEVTFEWLPDGEAHNVTGARILVNQLLLKWINEEPDLLLLIPGSNERLMGARSDQRNGTTPGSLFFPEERTNETHTSLFFGNWNAATLWCGIKTPLQGLTIDLRERQKDTTDCWNGPHSWAADDYSVIVHAVGGNAPNRFAVVDSYVTEDLDDQWGGGPFMRTTYLEGFPYATRMEFMSGQVGSEGYSAAYKLAGYARGTSPVATEPKVLAAAPDPVVLAPRTVTGPDVTGFGHPYPLSEAFAQASADPSFSSLQEYLAAHPDAFVGQAYVHESTDNGRTSYHWYVVLTDGTDQFAYRHIHTVGPIKSPVGMPVPAPILQSAGGDSYDRLTNGWEDGPFLPAAQQPSRVPTVASLVSVWSSLTGHEAANAYGFDLRCSRLDNGTCQSWPAFYAGMDDDDSTGIVGVSHQRTIFRSTLQTDEEGNLVLLTERTSTYDASHLPREPVSSSGDPPAKEAAGLGTLPDNSWIPTSREAAAIGGLAFLVTMAYWLWPVAKAGGVGLFSRVGTDKLLENPLRAQLVQRIEAEPGIHHNSLVRDLGKGKGAAEHHLDKLVEARLVLRNRGTGYTCYFPVGTDRRAMMASSALKADGARRILEALAAGPRGVRQIAGLTGLAPSTVSHHLGRLQEAGVVAGDGAAGYHAVHGAGASVAA